MSYDVNEQLDGTPLFMVRQVDVKGKVECNIHPVRDMYAAAIKQCLAEDNFFNDLKVDTVAHYGKITSLVFHYSTTPGELSCVLAEIEDRINDVLNRFIDSMHGYHEVQA